jgi:hypothetical protein
MVKFRLSMHVDPDGGVVSAGITIEGDALKKMSMRKIRKEVKGQVKLLEKDVIKEAKKVKNGKS